VVIEETKLDGASEERALTEIGNNHIRRGLNVADNNDEIVEIVQKSIFDSNNVGVFY
jgi:hypothetical protein